MPVSFGTMRSPVARDGDRVASGELSVEEQRRRHRETMDDRAAVARCAFPGCEEWLFEGTALECRDEAAAHRARMHPAAGVKRRRPGRSGEDQQRDEMRAAAAGRAVAVTKHDAAATSAPKRRWQRWSHQQIVAAIRAFAKAHGRPPGAAEWKTAGDHPSAMTVIRAFGSWAAAVEAAGFSRPSRSTRYRSRAAA